MTKASSGLSSWWMADSVIRMRATRAGLRSRAVRGHSIPRLSLVIGRAWTVNSEESSAALLAAVFGSDDFVSSDPILRRPRGIQEFYRFGRIIRNRGSGATLVYEPCDAIAHVRVSRSPAGFP